MFDIQSPENMIKFEKTGLNNNTYLSNPKRNKTRCPVEYASSVDLMHPLNIFYGNISDCVKRQKGRGQFGYKVWFENKVMS